jgi:hypothetical protein
MSDDIKVELKTPDEHTCHWQEAFESTGDELLEARKECDALNAKMKERSELSDKQWDEYLAKDKRMILHRVHGAICSAMADLSITGQQELRDEAAAFAAKIEAKLKELYGEANK